MFSWKTVIKADIHLHPYAIRRHCCRKEGGRNIEALILPVVKIYSVNVACSTRPLIYQIKETLTSGSGSEEIKKTMVVVCTL